MLSINERGSVLSNFGLTTDRVSLFVGDTLLRNTAFNDFHLDSSLKGRINLSSCLLSDIALLQKTYCDPSNTVIEVWWKKNGLMRSRNEEGCTHLLDLYDLERVSFSATDLVAVMPEYTDKLTFSFTFTCSVKFHW